MNDKNQLVKVLLVEDNIADIRITQEALKESKLQIDLNTVNDGVQALEYLRRQGNYKDADRPDLILLDLNMPRKDGRETLKEIKEDEDLRRIPVVILTVSKDEEDIIKTYNMHANCYIPKPVKLEQFMEIVKAIDSFWFAIVKLPPNGKKKG